MNRYKPHVLVIPEDDANRQLVLGFQLHYLVREDLIHVERPARGWTNVRDFFLRDHQPLMRKFPDRFVVLLLDFDGDINRGEEIRGVIDQELQARVFILGALSEPEVLKSSVGEHYDAIGTRLAGDCREEMTEANLWSHQLLRQNQVELQRARQVLSGFLFKS